MKIQTVTTYYEMKRIAEEKYCTELQILHHLFGKFSTVQDGNSATDLVICDSERQNIVTNTLTKQCMRINDLMT